MTAESVQVHPHRFQGVAPSVDSAIALAQSSVPGTLVLGIQADVAEAWRQFQKGTSHFVPGFNKSLPVLDRAVAPEGNALVVWYQVPGGGVVRRAYESRTYYAWRKAGEGNQDPT